MAILPLLYFYLIRKNTHQKNKGLYFLIKLWGIVLITLSGSYIAWLLRAFYTSSSSETHYIVNPFTLITVMLASVLFISYYTSAFLLKSNRIWFIGLTLIILLFFMVIFLPMYGIADIANPKPYEFFWKPTLYNLPSLILAFSYFFIGKQIATISSDTV